MAAKVTMVTLSHTVLGDRDFEVSHAERLLATNDNGGWKLPKGSKYELKDGCIIIRKVKKGTDGAEKA